MKKLILTLFMPYLMAVPVFADEVQDKQSAPQPRLEGADAGQQPQRRLMRGASSPKLQQVTVTNSFLVFIKTKACCNASPVQPEKQVGNFDFIED